MLCCHCLLDGKESCGDPQPMRSLIGCDNARVASSLLFLILTEYLKRDPNRHVVLLKSKYCDESYPLLFRDKQFNREPSLSRIHIKYVRSFQECCRFLLVAPIGYKFSLIAIDNWNTLMEEDGLVNRSQSIALLKQAGLPYLLVDNSVSLSLLRQYSEPYRSWFSDIFLVRNTSPTEYGLCRLFSGENVVENESRVAVGGVDSIVANQCANAMTANQCPNTIITNHSPHSITTNQSPHTITTHPCQCTFSVTQTLVFQSLVS